MTHVLPVNDVADHTTEGLDCQCQPRIDWKNSKVMHNYYDGRESAAKVRTRLTKAGTDILGEISAVQRLLESPMSSKLQSAARLRREWIRMLHLYRTGKWKQARGIIAEIRCLTSAVLVDFPIKQRDEFLQDSFELGYEGWVNEMDSRLDQ